MVKLRVKANEGVGKGNLFRYKATSPTSTGVSVILESPAKLKIGDVVEATEIGKLTYRHKK